MKRTLAVVACLILAGCAATPMSPEAYHANISAQRESLDLEGRCCVDYSALTSVKLTDSQFSEISSLTQVTKVGGKPVPVLAFELPTSSEGKLVEVFSFGQKKGGSLRLDRVLFVKPNYVFLDAQRQVISVPRSSPVCWGDFDWSSIGVWNRAVVPGSARFLIIAPDLSSERQLVDTRRYSHSPVVDAIAESRKSYMSEVSFGYTGELSVRLIESEAATEPKRCTADATPAA